MIRKSPAAPIGTISRAHMDGREDRRDGKKPATASQRSESGYVHAFYLLGYREFRWTKGCPGFPQLELFLAPGASPGRPGTQLDISLDSQAGGGPVSGQRADVARPHVPHATPLLAACMIPLAACLDRMGPRVVMYYRT